MYCGAVEFVCTPSMIKHVPVLLEESLTFLNVENGGRFADLTYGGGGHSDAILAANSRNELVSLNYDDLNFVNEGLKINVRKSKTDQFGEGSIKALPYFDNPQYCPVKSVQKWLKLSKIKEEAIFRKFHKGNKLSNIRLSDQSVALLIKYYLNKAGIDSSDYSGHSLRSGFATSAAEAGAEERSIMNMTGHKSTEMVRKYIKEANLFKNNALNKIKM